MWLSAQNLSGIVWTLIPYVTLPFRDNAGQLRSVTDVAPKSPLLCVKRSPIGYGFRARAKFIRHSVNTYPICDSSSLEITRGAASLRYRNRAEITILMCEQKPYRVWYFVSAQDLSGIVWTLIPYVTLHFSDGHGEALLRYRNRPEEGECDACEKLLYFNF